MDKRVINQDSSIINASSIVISDGYFPCRIVLRLSEMKDEYIVHLETLKGCHVDEASDSSGTGIAFKHFDYMHGKYFNFHPQYGSSQSEAKKKAEDNFLERSHNLSRMVLL